MRRALTVLVQWWMLLPLAFLLLPAAFVWVWLMHVGMMLGMALLLTLRPLPAEARAIKTQPWEPRLYDLMGLRFFHTFLTVTGWNDVILRWRRAQGGGLDVPALQRHTRQSEWTHWAGVLFGGVGSCRAIRKGQRSVGTAHLFLLVFLHLYSIAVQRQLRGRLVRVQQRR